MRLLALVLFSVLILAIGTLGQVFDLVDENVLLEDSNIQIPHHNAVPPTTTVKPNGPKTNVIVFYDAQDAFSRQFFLEVLIPLWHSLNDYALFEIKPIARSMNNSNGHWTFICAGRETNCGGNIFHACVLHSHIAYENKLKFLECYMKSGTNSSLSQCAEHNGISVSDVNSCVKSDQGGTYYSDYTKEAFKVLPLVGALPKVIINGELIGNSVTDVQKAVCKSNANCLSIKVK